jgi:hypothetical protein
MFKRQPTGNVPRAEDEQWWADLPHGGASAGAPCQSCLERSLSARLKRPVYAALSNTTVERIEAEDGLPSACGANIEAVLSAPVDASVVFNPKKVGAAVHLGKPRR